MKSVRHFFIFLTIVFQAININAQVSQEEFDALKKAVQHLSNDKDSLQNKYSDITAGRSKLEQRLLKLYSTSFDDMELTVRDAFDQTDVISVSATYQDVIKSIIVLHNEITKVNNFTDAQKVFGFDFIAQINRIAESKLIDQMIEVSKNESQKLRNQRKTKFKSIVSNILRNPVINSFIKSNPITSVAHSIINQTMSAQSTQIKDITITRGDYQMPSSFKDFKKDYSGFKSSYETSSLVGLPESQRIILNESIDDFTKELQPLIKLFDDLSKINEKYESSLNVFLKASEQTISRAKPVEAEFYKKLKTNKRIDARNKINQFFNIGTDPSLELLESKLNNEEMKEVLRYADEVNEVNILLKNDFLKVISLEVELSEAYIKFFEELKNGKRGLPKFDNTETIEKKISRFQDIKKNLEVQIEKLKEK